VITAKIPRVNSRLNELAITGEAADCVRMAAGQEWWAMIYKMSATMWCGVASEREPG
jgi:hypothetical protein